MRGLSSQLLLLMLGLLCTKCSNSEAICIEEEKQALLEFKQGLEDNYSLLSSWGSHEEDCCKWKGIKCSNQTGHVVVLDLRPVDGNLQGEISSSLLGLKHLVYLDLSLNHFFILPSFIGSLTKLQYLNLSNTKMVGNIPQQLGNLSSLISLDLSLNELEGSIPKALGNMISLVHLDLSSNNFEGMIPQALENLYNLQVLDLSNNSISGEVPDLSKFPLLRELHLSKNRLNGSLTKGMGKLSKLQILDVSSNSFEGDITDSHLSNLSSLKLLDFSYNSLSLKFSSTWVPRFNLDTIALRSCKLGPAFPEWLQTQRNFMRLDMSNTGISDPIPNWFWDLSWNVGYLNLSRNQFTNTIPLQWFLATFIGSPIIDLSFNRFRGMLPQLNFDWTVLNLSNNLFQGSITFICETNGSVKANYMPSYLSYLDLSHNLLSGELPYCWGNMVPLTVLNLANNNLSGRIPDSICGSTTHGIQSLHLQNNSFTGELPKSMITCSSLRLLDLGENRISGKIPTWIGTSLPHLMILRLSSNLLIGHIPLQLCHLTSLQILDLSQNSITGTIPRCLNNFTLMSQTQSSYVSIPHPYISSSRTSFLLPSDYMDNLLVTFKEKRLEYSKTLGLVKVINLSSNKLKGEIPREITSLRGLIGLNLSRNFLTGIIPQDIGYLGRLESLDLSRNLLSGIIPQSLVTLSLLSYLSLSNNNLSGKIPSGTQLQSFSASAYAGNENLCGLPLLKICLGDEATQNPQIGGNNGEGNIQEHANSNERLWFYISMALGFIVGFWGVCGSLLLKSSWRHAYFRYLERIGDRLYKTITITMAKLLRNFKTRC